MGKENNLKNHQKDTYKPDLELWVREARNILNDHERIFDIAGRRLALLSTQLGPAFTKPENTFRLAVIGNPNLGKTTYTYSCKEILKAYNFPASYVDLDIYTKSGQAISGQIDWVNRRKKKLKDLSESEVYKDIENFASEASGIVPGDFPGMVNDPFQTERLRAGRFGTYFL